MLLLLLHLALLPAAAAASEERPNILLIVVDALRADHLGVYGYGRPTSPVIDALARRGIVYRRAYSSSSWTLPAIAALLSGAPPVAVRSEAPRFLAEKATTLAESLGVYGYSSAAFVANPIVDPKRGFGDGFANFFRAPFFASEKPSWDDFKYGAQDINARAARWLRPLGAASPWFAYVHYMEPHHPYVPALEVARRFWRGDAARIASERERLATLTVEHARKRSTAISSTDRDRLVDLYDASIAAADAAIGDLLRGIGDGVLAQTIVCITADHGEAFADHGDYLHAVTLFEELIRVPLILVPPGGAESPAVVDRVVRLEDVAPTLLQLAGITPPAAHAGKDLLGGKENRMAVAELERRSDHRHERAVVDGQKKLIVGRGGSPALLFDLETDPGEHRDQGSASAGEVARLLSLLGAAKEAEAPGAATGDADLDPATREAMRALGYLP